VSAPNAPKLRRTPAKAVAAPATAPQPAVEPTPLAPAPGPLAASTSPPVSPTPQPPAEERLAALDEWAMQPLTPEATGVAAVAPVPPRPWHNVDPGRIQQLNVDVPAALHAKLRWIGQTTYGLSMRQYIVEVLEKAVEASLKERGDV
jgi:hypothetical protein